ncbi:MAG: ATP-binding protein [Muribaculaceae bacterium]|nr:ATP-binding protein [Muribaculaceae bacterium]MBR6488920.1 ATP-binding protein [Muribaculaceae bacterium]
MIIGRKKEQQRLIEAYESDYSEFVAVYGRRRVGKTFLIRETFNYHFTFQHAGVANGSMREQLSAFADSLADCGYAKRSLPSDWISAFSALKEIIQNSDDKKKVIFIDEMPWMDTARSGFVSALEHFWNSWASARRDILLIICGSATSWIIKKVFHNHGGLHNRVTYRIHLLPFTLIECEQYAQSRGLVLSRYQIALGYMIMGGIPFYWSQMKRSLSLDQNIDRMFFDEESELYFEYHELFDSLFKSPEPYKKVVSCLGRKRLGMTRDEIIKAAKFVDNGKVTEVLDNLQSCGFVRKYQAFGKKNKALYQLTDSYTLFYFKFIQNNINHESRFWSFSVNTPLRNSWQGLAFEQLCFAHLPQIKKSLGIDGVVTNTCSWQGKNDDGSLGAQIDMLIVRADNVINLCEMKFASSEYTLAAKDIASLNNKVSLFRENSNKKSAVHVTMITTFGLVHNAYWGDIQSEVMLDDLFL